MANYKKVIPFFLQKEGGLSRATTDTASKNPAPCSYQGKTGYHTNKGVTWSTFKNNAGKLDYSATCSNFISMPSDIWGKIFKNSFWDFWDSDNIPFQSIADFMTWTVWGSGGGTFGGSSGSVPHLTKYLKKNHNITATSKNDVKNQLIKLAEIKGERELWEDLIQYRYDWYATLNQPANLKGWRNGLMNYKDWGLKNYNFKKISGRKLNLMKLGAALIVAGSIYYLFTNNKTT